MPVSGTGDEGTPGIELHPGNLISSIYSPWIAAKNHQLCAESNERDFRTPTPLAYQRRSGLSKVPSLFHALRRVYMAMIFSHFGTPHLLNFKHYLKRIQASSPQPLTQLQWPSWPSNTETWPSKPKLSPMVVSRKQQLGKTRRKKMMSNWVPIRPCLNVISRTRWKLVWGFWGSNLLPLAFAAQEACFRPRRRYTGTCCRFWSPKAEDWLAF